MDDINSILPLSSAETLGQLVKLLKARQGWDSLISDVKQSFRMKIDNAGTPEEAYKVTLELQAVDRFFAFIQQTTEGK
jgi:hypothetical protein